MSSSELFAAHLGVYGGAVVLQPLQQGHVAHTELLPDGPLEQARLDQSDGFLANRNGIMVILVPTWDLLGYKHAFSWMIAVAGRDNLLPQLPSSMSRESIEQL